VPPRIKRKALPASSEVGRFPGLDTAYKLPVTG
jgi:hypothetical protein